MKNAILLIIFGELYSVTTPKYSTLPPSVKITFLSSPPVSVVQGLVSYRVRLLILELSTKAALSPKLIKGSQLSSLAYP